MPYHAMFCMVNMSYKNRKAIFHYQNTYILPKLKLYEKNRFHDESGIPTASHFLSAL